MSFIIILGILLLGCSIASGPAGTAVALGQSSSKTCGKVHTLEADKASSEGHDVHGCVEAEGGPLSDGVVESLHQLIQIPFGILRGIFSYAK